MQQIFNFNKIYDYNSYQTYASKLRVRLGSGTNGTVHKVFINDTMPIAVKEIILEEEKEKYTKQINDLQKEANLLMKMDHPNIMKVYFSFAYINEETHERFYYIGMECAPYDLAKILKERKTLSQFEISQLASQLQSALAYLEQNKIAHRDLKPENILRTEGGIYKLCDFSEYKWQEQTLKTYKNTLAGTPNYLSPELMKFFIQFQKDMHLNLNPTNKLIYDPYKSDVFSFGLILLQCILGCHEVNIGALSQNENGIKQLLNTKCSKEMKWFLEKCLDFNPKNRVSFNEMTKFLQLDLINVSHQLVSEDLLNQVKSQELIIKQINTQLLNSNTEFAQLQNKEKQQNTQIQKLNNQIKSLEEKILQMDQALNSVQQLPVAQPMMKKTEKEIADKCLANQDSWKNKSQKWIKNEFNKNTNGLKWNHDASMSASISIHVTFLKGFNHGFYDDGYHPYRFWNEKTGKTQTYDTYWRDSDNGKAWSVCDQDIPAAIASINKLASRTGYEFGLCLMMLHSNLWNFEKSAKDLME